MFSDDVTASAATKDVRLLMFSPLPLIAPTLLPIRPAWDWTLPACVWVLLLYVSILIARVALEDLSAVIMVDWASF